MENDPKPASVAPSEKESPYRAAILGAVVALSAAALGAYVSGLLAEASKQRELDIAATRRAIESVENMTKLIFQRDVVAGLVASSIKRNASIEETVDRKKRYDEAYVEFNSNIQSDLFNIRDAFHSDEYRVYDNIMRDKMRLLLVIEDQCVTRAYDSAIDLYKASAGARERIDLTSAANLLENCANDSKGSAVPFKIVHEKILLCEYTQSEDLFRVVVSPKAANGHASPDGRGIEQSCELDVNPSKVPLFQLSIKPN